MTRKPKDSRKRICEILNTIRVSSKELSDILSYEFVENESILGKLSEIQRLYQEFDKMALDLTVKKYDMPIMREDETFKSRPYIEWVKNFVDYMRREGEFSLENIRPYELDCGDDHVYTGIVFDVKLNRKAIGFLAFRDTDKIVNYQGKLPALGRIANMSYNYKTGIRGDGWEEIVFP